MTNETKNDVAWAQLFERYNILKEIKLRGQFIIKSTQINKVRESRLMAKFDHYVNLPEVFKDNNLSILPVSRSQYAIAPFSTHQKVVYASDLEIEPVWLPPHIESIDQSDLYSEAVALNCAFNAGIIDRLINETTYHTISGRMSTGEFNFSISSSISSEPTRRVDVVNSQCEIDGGFEGEHFFVLLEAKNYAVDDFHIRQLYYPYRLWAAKISKRVIPILMTFSQDTFDFFVYRFTDETNYSSLQLVQQKRYQLAPEAITRNDINTLFLHVRIVPEPEISFPQANTFNRVIDLLTLLAVEGTLTKDEITENYEFDARQTNYYTDAARYLGLAEKYTEPSTKEITFRLTEEGQRLLRKRPKQKTLGLIQKILEHIVYYKTFHLTLQNGIIPTIEEISQIITASSINISGDTVPRRASTVRGWIEWIWKQIED